MTAHRKQSKKSIGSHFPKHLAEEMVKAGLVTSDQLAVARVSQEGLGEDLGHILVKKGFISEEQFLSFLGKALEIPYSALQEESIQADLVQKIPLRLAQRYHLFPIREEQESVVVAMSNPLDRAALDDLRIVLGSEVKPILSSEAQIDSLIDQYYGLKEWGGGGETAEQTEEIEVLGMSTSEPLEARGDKLEQISTGPKVVQTVNQLLLQAYQDKASDIHLEPERDFLRIRYRIDGFLEERMRLPRQMHLPTVSRIKIMGGLDIAERRIPQDGRVRLRIGASPLDIRVSSYPTLYGEKVVLRLLSKEALIGIESLGFSDRERKSFTDLVTKSHGIFLVTGPTGSGKSTTLYAALMRINSVEKNIISIEDPVESEIPGVNQAQINPKAGVTFASALRSILRQDPDVIMIGEVRDAETAEIAVRAAITGHLVLSTLHTNTAAGAISRLIDLKVEPFLISSALIGVLAQRLVRRICPSCRQEVKVDPARLGPLAQYVKKTFRGRGCLACRMSGFSGRIGIFELAPIGESVRKLIAVKATDDEIEREFRRLGVRSMLEDGMEKVNDGITTIDEVLRVTQEN